ncbi:Two component regulator propeller [Chitinophaga terrae (ex Kim and Jung 2007)]|uniref:histidine kinase n=1 Tax=Chitinophaga terrae (ex Kim and Jung 2007) TaxID=408074 RepID=A0A1H4FMW2_9BACT|nr:two-component regulator propeller domain-containing protein [Chitinophaga terrae (ex Kim and Jung 2007)]SEA98160.1 Two component regulator propeller [Chitinophaga terrae (ex Kim and Jung 2007)]
MKRWLFHCLLSCCILFTVPALYASDPLPYNIWQLDNRNGLSNSAVNSLYVDSDQLLWVATWDGLNMYDGNAFRVFNYNKENPGQSIGNNVVMQVTEDGKGRIWLSTIEGVSQYDKRSGKCFNYFYSRQGSGRVSERDFLLLTDTSGQLFCLNQQSGLTQYNAEKDSFIVNSWPRSNNRVVKAVFDGGNRLWVLRGDAGLEVYEQQNATWRLVQRHPDVQSLFVPDGRVFFVTNARQLMVVDPRTLVVQQRGQLPHAVNALIYYKSHYLFAWSTQGFGVYDNDLQPADQFMQEIQYRLKDIRITSWATGTEEILWCGTDGNGIMKIAPPMGYFGGVTRATGGPAYSKPVRAFVSNGNNLWVGTKGSGIISIPQVNGTLQVDKQQLFTEELDNNAVFALCKGADSLIYIGTDGKGLTVYDQLSRRFLKWAQVEGSAGLPAFGSVYVIVKDPDNSLWLGTSGYGLIHLQMQRTAKGLKVTDFQQYTYKGTGQGPSNDIIYSLTLASNNGLWVGCRYGGLNYFNKGTQQFTFFKAFGYEGSLSHNDVLAVYKDSQRRLWVGTSYGLNYIQESSLKGLQPVFTRFNTGNGLPNNTIHAITEDDKGQVWASTNKGLARIDPATGEIAHFQETDGLQSNEFSDGAAWKDEEGRLYFGGIYGFNYFHSDNIRQRRWYPNLLVTSLQLAGKGTENGLWVLKPGQDPAVAYTLSRRDNFFELQARALSFLQAEKCEYAWQLEGFDQSWQYSGGTGKVAYGNLPPGNYVLKVKWSNGEGEWTVPGTLVHITVEQFFWLTWPAFVLYFVLMAAIGTAFWFYRKNKMEMKHQLEMEHLLRKKEEEVHATQLHFFTNIAHELQTPLTLIVGAAERSRENPTDAHNMALVHQQASRLTYLVQQLLEFRRAEAGYMKTYYTTFNISDLVENIVALFQPLGKKQQLHWEINIAPGMVAGMDKDKLEKILFNLLSNACKYTKKGERIVFNAGVKNNALEIYVYNSGSQLSDAQLEGIFTRFFTAGEHTQEYTGTGIGLAFTQQLVLLLKGNIFARNEDGGIAFHVSLPLPAQVGQTVERTTPSYLLKSIVADLGTDSRPELDPNKLAIIRSAQQSDKKSILLVEDEAAIRQLLKELLAPYYIIYEAENGAQALEFIRQTMPDLIISDIMMPDMNGLELCNKIKEAPASCHIPFIILSARGTIDQQTEGYEAGADAYLPKPFYAAHLLVRVRKLLEYRQRLHDIFKTQTPLAQLGESEVEDKDKQFLQELVAFIEQHMDEEELNAEMLEKHFLLSRMQLYRKLKTLSNMTPNEFIRYVRLQQAAILLVKTQLTVAEIFYRTGFNNQSYFFREFKKLYHCSPSEFREQQTIV